MHGINFILFRRLDDFMILFFFPFTRLGNFVVYILFHLLDKENAWN